MTSSQDTAV